MLSMSRNSHVAGGAYLIIHFMPIAEGINFIPYPLFDPFWNKIPAQGRRGETNKHGAKRILFGFFPGQMSFNVLGK